MIFQEITIHDFSTPLAARAKARKSAGPYRWTPSTSREGRGFYMGEGLAMDRAGSTVDLRVSLANDYLQGSLSRINGYYCDEFGDCTLQPIVIALPHGRGFMAGWTMGENMASSFDYDIYETAKDAAITAHSMAENAAEDEREYRAENDDDDDEA